MSFAAVDGADNRDRLAGGKRRRRGGFSIKASPSALQHTGGRPELAPGRGREEAGEFHIVRLALPLFAAFTGSGGELEDG